MSLGRIAKPGTVGYTKLQDLSRPITPQLECQPSVLICSTNTSRTISNMSLVLRLLESSQEFLFVLIIRKHVTLYTSLALHHENLTNRVLTMPDRCWLGKITFCAQKRIGHVLANYRNAKEVQLISRPTFTYEIGGN